MSMASINDYLPRELLVKIFSYYIESEGPVKFLRNVSPVCKLWKDLCPTHSLWKEVNWRSIKWNSDHLINLGERGFLVSTLTLNLSCEELLIKEDSEMIESSSLKIEDLLQLIDCCHNLKVLDVSLMNFMNPPSGYDGRIISKIADCCPLLEELHFENMDVDDIEVNHLFPIDEIRKGCRKLRVLKISNCRLEWSNNEDLEGFKEIRSFSAMCCDFRGHDVSEILKSSTELEDLHLSGLRDMELAHLNEIPTEKVKILEISHFRDMEPVKKAVNKWRLTLTKLTSSPFYHRDLTGVLKALVEDNPNPLIEEISVISYVDVQFMKSLIRDCQKLRYLLYCDGYVNSVMRGINFYTRESLVEYSES